MRALCWGAVLMDPLSRAARKFLVGLVEEDLIRATITGACVEVSENGDITILEVEMRLRSGEDITLNVSDDSQKMVLGVNEEPAGRRRVSVDHDYDEDLWRGL